MQMNLFRKVSLLEFRAASSSDAVKPTPCARIGFWTRGRGGGSSLLGSALPPAGIGVLPCTGVRPSLYGGFTSPVRTRQLPLHGCGGEINENENEGPPYR